jgi:REP element-mobilizing transposase RayT
MRAKPGLPNFRSDELVFRAVRDALAGGQKGAFRVVHFSVQSDHLHLIVEAGNGNALPRGMQGLNIRIARAVNRVMNTKGSVFVDRYHARELKTPGETRAALLYVLQNWAMHGSGGDFDPLSSAVWFDGWTRPPTTDAPPSRVAAPHTWLAAEGWRRHGLLRPGEQPASLGPLSWA